MLLETKLQQSGLQLSERLTSLGMVGATLTPIEHHSTMVSWGLRRALNQATIRQRDVRLSGSIVTFFQSVFARMIHAEKSISNSC